MNCLDCKYYDSIGPSYYLMIESEKHICWKDVNIERRDPVKYIDNPLTEKSCCQQK